MRKKYIEIIATVLSVVGPTVKNVWIELDGDNLKFHY
jgi:hypothetical protein